MKPLLIILIGKPGSGKGTQAKLLQKKFKLEYIGSGDLLRKRAQKKDFTGKKIAKVISQGKRMPTPVIFKLWMDKLEEFKKKSNFRGLIFDGSPRTLTEAEMLEEALKWYEWQESEKVILVKISSKTAIKRLSSRKICLKCGKIFAISKKEKITCFSCGGSLITRPDDTKEGIKERLRWFQTEVQPVLAFYKKRGRLLEVDGEKSIKDVFKEILKVLNFNAKKPL